MLVVPDKSDWKGVGLLHRILSLRKKSDGARIRRMSGICWLTFAKTCLYNLVQADWRLTA